MAGRLRESRKGQNAREFQTSHALVIGINDYGNGIRPLTTPVNDASRLARLLAEEHGYEVHLLVEGVTKARLEAVLTEELPPQVGENDRMLLYFAGHGIALDGDDGPQGYLVPQDADAADRDTLLPMTDLHGWLDALPCRHMLAILDCCFAGAFRWASTRHMDVAGLEEIHQERYERFLRSPAWQVLTSAAYDQEALDLVAGRAVGSRGVRREREGEHSPFALALYQALRGDGDLIPKGDGDGLITATELYLYLREQVEVGVGVEVGHDQTPGLWPLNRHDRGEYVFLAPGHPLNLPPAPELTTELNPWRGLKSYDQKHGALFFGREEEVEELAARVKQQPFTAVLGASGTGKSSLVKAGLLPYLDNAGNEDESAWLILPPLRPGRTPLQNLHRLLRTEVAEHAAGITPARMKQDAGALVDVVGGWRRDNPGRGLLLVVDQLEELVTLADEQAREQFLAQLAEAIKQHPQAFRLVITLRTDFEPQFNADGPLAPFWEEDGTRYVIPRLDQADLRTVIEGPASERVLYFEPPELVDDLINEVLQMPGALPLLSFTLSEMYLHYLQSGRDNRALAQEDYDALGGVIGSLRNRANAEYEALPDDAHRETMRRVMLRMISVEGGELARRRVYRSELDYPTAAENERVQTVLDRLVAARLMVTSEDEGQATVEPAHDALVLAWDRLLRWKQTADAYLPLQRRLAQAANEWGVAEAETQSGLLWDDDPRLPQLEETLWPTRSRQDGLHGRLRWARQIMAPDTKTPADTQWLNGREVAFVQASVQARASFWRRVTSSVSLFILVLIAATAISLTLQQRAVAAEGDARAAEGTAVAEATNAAAAEETAVVEASRAVAAEETAVAEREIADSERSLALGRQLAAQSIGQIDRDLDAETALLLAVQSARMFDRADTPYPLQVSEALRYSLANSPRLIVRYPITNPVSPSSIDFSSDARVRFNSSGAFLAIEQLCGLECSPLRLIEINSSQEIFRLASDLGNVSDYRITSDDKHLIVITNHPSFTNGKVMIFGLPSGNRIHEYDVTSYVISDNGKVLAFKVPDGRINLLRLSETKTSVEDLDPLLFSNDMTLLSLNDEGNRLVTVDSLSRLQLWNTVNSPPQLVTLVGNPSAINLRAAAILKNNYLFADFQNEDSSLGQIMVWDLSTEDTIIQLPYRSDPPCFAADPEENWLVEEALANGIRLEPISKAEILATLGESYFCQDILAYQLTLPSDTGLSFISDVYLSYDDNQLVIVSQSDVMRPGTLDIFDLNTGNLVASVDHFGSIIDSDIVPSRNFVTTISSSAKELIKPGPGYLWSLSTGQLVKTLRHMSVGGLSDIAFSRDGTQFATIGIDNTLRVWDLDFAIQRTIMPLTNPSEAVRESISSELVDNDAEETPREIVSSEYEWPVVIQDKASQEIVSEFGPGSGGFLIHAALSGDGKKLVTLEGVGFARTQSRAMTLWDVDSGSELTHIDGVTQAAFSPDWQLLATGGMEGAVSILFATTGEPLLTYNHEVQITAVSFDSTGKLLASGSEDGTVRIWYLNAQQELARLPHDAPISSLKFTEDGSQLIVEANAQLYTWIVDIDSLTALACKRVSRNFTLSEWQFYLPNEPYQCTCSGWPMDANVLAAAEAGKVTIAENPNCRE